MDPLRPVLIGRDMLPAQVIHIRKGQPRQAAEREHVADTGQPVVRQRLVDKRIELLFRQRNLDVRPVGALWPPSRITWSANFTPHLTIMS